MKIRNKAIPAVYLILEREDGRFLIARRCNTGYQDGNYQVPAGHVDEGELPTESMIREAKEEIGINIQSKDLQLVHFAYSPKHDDTDNRINLYFKTKKWQGEIKNMEPNKCDDLLWVSMKELPSNIAVDVLDALKCIEQGICYKELGIDFFKEHGLYML